MFVYNAGGKLVAEYSTTVASQSTAQVSYLTNDHLGSPRITTDKNGKVYSRRDFLPFGEDLDINVTAERTSAIGYGPDSVRQKFTGYERDDETELDFAQARTFNYSLGRYTSPDNFAYDTNVIDPMSWNLYVYARNNPYKFIDPSGQTILVTSGGGEALIYTLREDGVGVLTYKNGDAYRGGDAALDAALKHLNKLGDSYSAQIGNLILNGEHYFDVTTGSDRPGSATHLTGGIEANAPQDSISTSSQVVIAGEDDESLVAFGVAVLKANKISNSEDALFEDQARGRGGDAQFGSVNNGNFGVTNMQQAEHNFEVDIRTRYGIGPAGSVWTRDDLKKPGSVSLEVLKQKPLKIDPEAAEKLRRSLPKRKLPGPGCGFLDNC